MINEGGNKKYTPIIIDLIDNVNQGLVDTNKPWDQVTGYSIAEIESVLNESKNLQTLRDNLHKKYNKPSNIFLNELFEQYINL